MKKVYSILALIASISIFSSCSKEEENTVSNDEKVDMTFGVSLPDGFSMQTKAIVKDLDFSNESQSVIWQKDDKVTIFAKGHEIGDVFKFDAFSSSTLYNAAIFKGVSYKNSDLYYGLYPAQSGSRLVDGQLAFNVPCNQTAVANSFDPKAGVQIGVADSWDESSNTTLTLANVCSYFSISVESGCSSVQVTAGTSITSGEQTYLAGDVITKDISEASTAVKENGICQTSVKLSGGDIGNGGTFLIPFLPTKGCPSIHVAISYYGGQSGQKTITKDFIGKITKDDDGNDIQGTFQFVAGHIYSLGTVKYTD